jgi:tetratricopeptide (TPR) repeat protein
MVESITQAQRACQQKNFDLATQLYEIAWEKATRDGSDRDRTLVLEGMGELACWQGDFTEAIRCLEACLALYHVIGDRNEVRRILGLLTQACTAAGKLIAAQRFEAQAKTILK